MTRELKRDGLTVKLHRNGEHIDVSVTMGGSIRVKQVFDDLERARNEVCSLAREIGNAAKTAGHSETLRQAAQLFSFMREVRL